MKKIDELDPDGHEVEDALPEPGTNAQGEKYNALPVGSDYDHLPELDLGNTSGTPHGVTPLESTESSPVESLPSGVSSLAEFHRKFGGNNG